MVNKPRPLLDLLRDLEQNSQQREELRGEIGVAFASARLQHGYTQTSLAEALSTTQSYISQVESGQKSPSEDFLASAAFVFQPGRSVHDADHKQKAPRKKRRK